MSGTYEGGVRAAETNRERYGSNFYSKMGARGGSAPHSKPRGFAADKERARTAGKKGGKLSRRPGLDYDTQLYIYSRHLDGEPMRLIADDLEITITTGYYYLRKWKRQAKLTPSSLKTDFEEVELKQAPIEILSGEEK